TVCPASDRLFRTFQDSRAHPCLPSAHRALTSRPTTDERGRPYPVQGFTRSAWRRRRSLVGPPARKAGLRSWRASALLEGCFRFVIEQNDQRVDSENRPERDANQADRAEDDAKNPGPRTQRQQPPAANDVRNRQHEQDDREGRTGETEHSHAECRVR